MLSMGLGGNGMLKGNGVVGSCYIFACQITNRFQRTSSRYMGYV